MKINKPNKYLLKFFRWFCHPDYVEDIEGDVYEKYERIAIEKGQSKANWQFSWIVLSLFRPSLMRPINLNNHLMHPIMFRHNLKISWRLLFKNKGYSLINIGGLAMGMAVAMFIVLWIKDELRFDRFHADGDRIYKVMRHKHSGNQIETTEIVAWNIGEALRENYPEIDKVSIVSPSTSVVFQQAENAYREDGLFAQPAFFELFSWNLVAGDPKTVLTEPTGIAISTSLAKKYFKVAGTDYQQVIGQTMQHAINGLEDLKVTGVFTDIPAQSSLQFEYVLPIDHFFEGRSWLTGWANNGIHIYLKMKAGQDGMALNPKIVDIQNEHIEGFRSDIFLHPYQDQYLYAHFKDGKQQGGRIEYLRIFGLVALMTILIACINFTNLSTARSVQRVKEIGVRKAIGAEKRLLVGQFMGEALLLIVLAFAVALLLVPSVLPYFNELTGKSLAFTNLDTSTYVIFGGIGLLTAIIAGAYPAFYIASFDVVKILKGTFRQRANSSHFRKGLVLFQFVVSTLLIVGTITVYQQMQYIQNKNLGYDRANVLMVQLEGDLYDQYNVAKAELLQSPSIEYVSAGSESPLEVNTGTRGVSWRGKAPTNEASFNLLSGDFDFLKLMRMKLVEGRDFDPAFARDSFNYIINEKALEVMGLDNPIGEELSFWGNTGNIIGVVKGFHSASLYSPIDPLIIQIRPNWNRTLFVKTKPNQTAEAIAALEQVHSRLNPAYPFDYQFLDRDYAAVYQSEQTVGQLAFLFTLFAIIIACMGLLGLSIFAVQHRLKEISVRKVLGAEVGQLVTLLSKDFVLLILAAFVVASPMAYFVMNDWLGNFAFRTDLGWEVFLFTGGIMLLIALLTVGFYALKVATINPIQPLQSE
ncbi:MAG: ABC transporter permease [Bacteroidota bacterium]